MTCAHVAASDLRDQPCPPFVRACRGPDGRAHGQARTASVRADEPGADAGLRAAFQDSLSSRHHFLRLGRRPRLARHRLVCEAARRGENLVALELPAYHPCQVNHGHWTRLVLCGLAGDAVADAWGGGDDGRVAEFAPQAADGDGDGGGERVGVLVPCLSRGDPRRTGTRGWRAAGPPGRRTP